MVLNEKHNEQNQQKWLSRAKRERMNLSASVEEALEDPVAGGILWGEEQDEQSDFPEEASRKGVFPPRLSLQSRPVPALQSENGMETSLSSYPVISSEQESATPTQNTSMLKRFAQRLTSSFAALGGVSQPQEIIESSLPPLQEEGPIKLLDRSRMDEGIQQTFVSTSEPMSQTRTASQPFEPPNDDELRDRQSKLAGRTTRIHLETPPMMTPTRSVQPEDTRTEKFYSDISQQIPVGVNTTGARLPAADPFKGKIGVATRRELSGSGVFEPGQGDATVVNRYVTEASVVLVTLTANPGPVVIQYVTLRPRIGFTIHLTAPTAMRASFNYIVLLGELF